MKLFCDDCQKDVEHVLFDGYDFAERILEGVKFKLMLTGEVIPVDDWARDPYLEGLNAQHWLKLANEYGSEVDIGTCPHCHGDVEIIRE